MEVRGLLAGVRKRQVFWVEVAASGPGCSVDLRPEGPSPPPAQGRW